MKLTKLRPSPALIISLLALFVALGGVGVAATGGNFILGQSNSAGAKTSLSASIAGKALDVTNTNAGAGATALGLNVAPNHAPLVVSSGAGKAPNLNADKLDGVDSTGFLPKAGKAADADKLDGLSWESFTQGGGRFYSGHREGVSLGSEGTLLTIPGAVTINYRCEEGVSYKVPRLIFLTDVYGVAVTHSANGAPTQFRISPSGSVQETFSRADDFFFVNLLGSRPFNRMTFQPAVEVDVRASALWHNQTERCAFQAVGEVFG